MITAADVGVDGDALEAVAFAILGYQMLRGRQGNIPTRHRRARPRNPRQTHTTAPGAH